MEAHFGQDFPIRFDFLDTMGGGNLSLQVHPVTQYIRDTFGMNYTQDESYYLLDAEEGASVFLGLKTGVDPEAMLAALNVPVLGVRGNCDSRVDAMLLPFPFEDFAEALVYDKSFLLYHGDLPIKEGYEPDVIVSGHTHIPVLEEDEKGRILLNPGSTSFPKGGYPASYALMDKNGIKVLSLETDEPIFVKSF